MRFALLGASGFVAPRHMKAIHEVGGEVVLAMDPHDAAGTLDRYHPKALFSGTVEELERDLYEQAAMGAPVQYVSICSPNYCHLSHILLALRHGADVICEKPLVLNPSDLDILTEAEKTSGHRVWTVLQLRHHPVTANLRTAINWSDIEQVDMNIHVPRGHWYWRSWKGNASKSGGLFYNIGIHYFDLLIHLFGPVQEVVLVKELSEGRAYGTLGFKDLDVNWNLAVGSSISPRRTLTVGEWDYDFSDGMTDLHTTVYREILSGRGTGIEDARPAIALVQRLWEEAEDDDS